MTTYDKRRIVRLYGDGKSYVIASQHIDEKLQIKLVDSAVCLNKLTPDEWNALTTKTNSVRSASYSIMLEAYGCLGLMSTSLSTTTSNDDQSSNSNSSMQHCLLFVKEASLVGTIRKFEIMKITDVFLLPIFSDVNSNIYSQQQQQQQSFNNTNTNTNNTQINSNISYFNDLRKFLSSGVFYFVYSAEPGLSTTFDLTLSCQARTQAHLTNKKFFWNYNLHIPFRRLGIDTSQWLLKCICGCVEIKKVFTLSKSFKACLFSRLSCDRVGTRFQCRGLNDEGNCANFVETEQVLFSEDSDEENSFLQVRGSVPVFFEQTGIQVGNHRIKVSRGLDTCYPAFDRHVKSLVQEYGSQFYILNLLGTKGDESALTDFFESLCISSPLSMSQQLVYSNFDYHSEMKSNKGSLGDKMWPNLIHNLYADNHKSKKTDGMFFYYNNSNDNTTQVVIKQQTKFIRTNCMDCLDRTNNVQAYIGLEMLTYQLQEFLNDSETNKAREVRELFRQMWIINGDYISKIYAGTGAIQGKSKVEDISRSLTRAIQNNFLDSNKQDAIDTFLFSMSRNYGDLADRVKILMSQNFLRLPYSILRHMVAQYRQYTEQIRCRVLIGTWNINGGLSPGDMERLDLKGWLIDGPSNARKTNLGHLDTNYNNSEIDMFVIGFEEIVDLNAQNIVNASDEHAIIWLKKLDKFLKMHVHGNYVPLIIDPLQLVGVCIFVFVLKKHAPYIRDVCVSKSKTGLGGNAGNKGAVLVRFVYYNTSMCFVCSHFAAHQKEIKQRNDDFRQTYENSEFVGQSVTGSSTRLEVKMHDYVFWCGDLNYRIDLPNDKCRSLIAERDWISLLEQDQLSVQRKQQQVFREFNEAPISFPPTYKYNLFEDSYDRSEKCRVPAWTDRILWRRRLITRKEVENKSLDTTKCLYYGRADIRYSDHRPVSALFDIEVNKSNTNKLIEVLNRELVEVHGHFQVVLIVSTHTNQMNEAIINEILDLFQPFKSFGMFRKYKKNLYITYTDGRYGYEAYAQLNNTHLVINDLTLQIKIENEQIISKLIEQELMDCLMSLNKLTDTKTTPRLLEETNFNNNNNNNKNKNNPTINEVKVGDLLGDLLGDFNCDNEKENSHYFMNVPTKIHSNVSITDSLHSINTNRLVDFTADDTSSRHNHYHNPLNNKCLSNSNLTMFDQQENHDLIGIIQPVNNHPKSAHSAANLLDSMLDDIPNQTTNSLIAPPPPRPPPPPTTSFFNETTLIKSNSFGFDDDFSSFTNLNQKTTNKPQTPPPLPPFPSNNNKTTFSLFDDDPFEQTNTKSMQQQQQPTIIPTRPPPLPPMMQMPSIQNKPSSSSSIPPPLPPLPTTATSKTNLQGQINTNINNFNNVLQSSDLNLSNRLNSNNNNNSQKLVEFDAFGDSDFSKLNINAINNKPLPPPRPNHFK